MSKGRFLDTSLSEVIRIGMTYEFKRILFSPKLLIVFHFYFSIVIHLSPTIYTLKEVAGDTESI